MQKPAYAKRPVKARVTFYAIQGTMDDVLAPLRRRNLPRPVGGQGMIAALAVFIVIGVALGLWGDVSEQRRLERMARKCKTGGRS